MFKKTLLGAVILMGILVSGLNAGDYTIPSGYAYIKSVGGGALKVYHKNGIYVSVLDLSKGGISVGNVDPDTNNNNSNTDDASNKFFKHNLNYWWNNQNTSNRIGIFNGQFFSDEGSNKTGLSFPLRSFWHNINTQSDHNGRRTLKVYSNGETKILDGYTWMYLSGSKELIAGLNPNQNKSSWASIGRHYIGGIPKYDNVFLSDLKYLLFFIAKNKNQSSMDSEMNKWGISSFNRIMMDGSGSSQMKIGNLSVYGSNWHYFTHPDYRSIPNVIEVYSK